MSLLPWLAHYPSDMCNHLFFKRGLRSFLSELEMTVEWPGLHRNTAGGGRSPLTWLPQIPGRRGALRPLETDLTPDCLQIQEEQVGPSLQVTSVVTRSLFPAESLP